MGYNLFRFFRIQGAGLHHGKCVHQLKVDIIKHKNASIIHSPSISKSLEKVPLFLFSEK